MSIISASMNSVPTVALNRIIQFYFQDENLSFNRRVQIRLVNQKFRAIIDSHIHSAAPRTLQQTKFNTIAQFKNLKFLDLTKLYYTCVGKLWGDDDILKAAQVIGGLAKLDSLNVSAREMQVITYLCNNLNQVKLQKLSVDGISKLEEIEIIQKYLNNQQTILFLSLVVSGIGGTIEFSNFVSRLQNLSDVKEVELSLVAAQISISLLRFLPVKNLKKLSCHRIGATQNQVCKFVSSLSELESLTLGELMEDLEAEQPSKNDFQCLNKLKKFTVSVIDGASIRALKKNEVSTLQSLGAMSLFCPSYTLEKFGLDSIQTLNLCAHGKHVSYSSQNMDNILQSYPNVTTLCADVVDVSLFKFLNKYSNLRFLVLDFYGDFETHCAGIKEMKNMRNLKMIQFQDTKTKEISKQQQKAFFDNIGELKQIDALKIDFPVQLNSAISALGNLSQLCLLQLSNISQNCDLGFLTSMSNMFNLTLGGNGVGCGESIDNILQLQYCKSLDIRGIIIKQSLLQKLEDLRQLVSLKLRVFESDCQGLEPCVRRLESALPLLRQLLVQY